jgi:chromosome segregation ATPase
MGFGFKSSLFAKVFVIGGLAAGGTGLYVWAGAPGLEEAGIYMQDTAKKIEQYENGQTALEQIIANLKANSNTQIAKANGIISDKNGAIAGLEGDKTELAEQISTLNIENASLKEALETQKAELDKAVKDGELKAAEAEALKAELNGKIEELDTATAKVAELTSKNTELQAKVDSLTAQNAKLKETIAWGTEKVKEADKKVADLENELNKANADAAKLEATTNEAKTETQDKEPLTEEEINAIDTTLEEVTDGQSQPVEQPQEQPAQ